MRKLDWCNESDADDDDDEDNDNAFSADIEEFNDGTLYKVVDDEEPKYVSILNSAKV